ncbi:cytochrome P450 [Aspergillus cavernicola]|uniref:Cytochrome P450 n=1 Tax=Aspergillus cavernicola TaxID=176166 RepID=A0ABR4IC87_9EURO
MVDRDEAVGWDNVTPGMVYGVFILWVCGAVDACCPLELGPVVVFGYEVCLFNARMSVWCPHLAARTWWYEFYYDTGQSGQYVFKIQELHRQYGPITRVTPDEIHINDVGFLDTLRSLRVPGGVGTTADHTLYKTRREALTPFFSKRNILYLERVITDKVEQLQQLIAHHAASKAPANLSDAFFAYRKELMMGINLNKHFPQVPDFLESLPHSNSRGIMPPGLIDMLALFDRVRTELVAMMRAKESGIIADKPVGPTGKESVYDSVLDNPALPASQKSLLRLEQEGALLALAGTESPAQTLNVIFCHILANPTHRRSTVVASASWTDLEQLPYLSAVIEEGNRLSFGKPSKSYTIPPGTPISITKLSAPTAETIFPDPYTFNPDRWLGEAGKKRRKFQMAFSKGGRKCLGIELARAELYLVVAALILELKIPPCPI